MIKAPRQASPPALLAWAAGFPAHLPASAWLASVYGATLLPKPGSRELCAILFDCKSNAPAELSDFVTHLVRSLPPSFVTRQERRDVEAIIPTGMTVEPFQRGEGGHPLSSALIGWCHRHGRHTSTALWLLSLHGLSSLSKPCFDALETLLIDVMTHGSRALFELTASMVEALPPAFVTSAERESSRVSVKWLRGIAASAEAVK